MKGFDPAPASSKKTNQTGFAASICVVVGVGITVADDGHVSWSVGVGLGIGVSTENCVALPGRSSNASVCVGAGFGPGEELCSGPDSKDSWSVGGGLQLGASVSWMYTFCTARSLPFERDEHRTWEGFPSR